MENNELPTLADLTEAPEVAYKTDQFNLLLSQEPPRKWIKEHPIIKQDGPNGTKSPWLYLPIDKVEHLLRKIFKRYKIEITSQGTAFNGVWVTIRIHYYHPVLNEWMFHDGIGAMQMQTKKGTSPSDLANINHGAISMAFPLAKTLAIKDAADCFGNLFGANLNRKDLIEFKPDKNLEFDWDALNQLYELKKENMNSDEQIYCERIIKEQEKTSYRKLLKKLQTL